MFLSLCHSSHSSADAYDYNQQKEDKILPADIHVKQQWTHGPDTQVIMLIQMNLSINENTKRRRRRRHHCHCYIFVYNSCYIPGRVESLQQFWLLSGHQKFKDSNSFVLVTCHPYHTSAQKNQICKEILSSKSKTIQLQLIFFWCKQVYLN